MATPKDDEEVPLTPDEMKHFGVGPTETPLTLGEAKRFGVTLPTEPTLLDKAKTEGKAFVDDFSGKTRALLNTASLNILPRARAAGDAMAETLNGHGGVVSNYNRALTDRQADAEKDAAEHPSVSIIGSFLTPQIGRGLTLAQRLTAAAGAGALAGDLQAPHDNPKAQLAGALGGGAGGLMMQGGNELLSPVARAFSGGLRQFSGQHASNVAGGGKAQINDRMAKLGYDPEEHADFGNRLLDEGLIPTGLHPTQSPAEGVLARSRALKEQQGQRIGAEMQTADHAGELDPSALQSEMRQNTSPRNPLESDNSTKANKLIEQVGALTPQGEYENADSFSRANKMKSQAWDAANFKDDVPLEAKQYRKAVAGMRDGLRDQLAAVNGDESARRVSEANQRFGIAADAEALSKNAVSRGGQAQQFGLPAAIMTAAGAGIGAAAGGAQGAGTGVGATTAALIGSALLKSRGPTVAARLGRLGSDIAAGAANMSQNPAAAGAAASALERYFSGLTDDEKKAALAKLGK